MSGLLGLPPDWSAQGSRIDLLIGAIHVVMIALFVGWLVYLVVALTRFRAGAGRKVSYQGARGRVALAIVGAVFVSELVLMLGFEMPIWADRERLPDETEATVVRVVAEQFAWNFHYPGPDGVFGPAAIERIDPLNPVGLDYDHPDALDDLVTTNQLWLPVEQPVLLYLSSKDMVHSFSIPYLRVKQDVIPGATAPISFRSTRTGQTEIACAQLCGLGHYRMRAFVHFVTAREFEDWYQEELEYQ